MEIGEPSAADVSEGAPNDAAVDAPHRCLHYVMLHHGTSFVTQQVTQYVNLPREHRFLNARMGRPNLDRLSNTVRVRVALSDRQTGTCLMRYVAAGPEHERYSDAERDRHRHYQVLINGVQQTDFDENSDGNWIRILVENGDATLETQLNVAGGNEFRLEAKCSVCGTSMRGTVLQCGPLVVKRRMWVLPIAMQGLPVQPPRFAPVQEEFARCHLEVRFLPLQTMPFYRMIMGDTWLQNQAFHDAAQQVARDYWSSENHVDVAPYVITMLFIDQIGTKRRLPLTLTVPRFNRPDPGNTTPVTVQEVLGEEFNVAHTLWRENHPDADDSSDWLVEAAYVADNLTLDLRRYCRPSDDHRRVLIDTINGIFDHPQFVGDRDGFAPGRIRLRVNIIAAWGGGQASSVGRAVWLTGRGGEATIPLRAMYAARGEHTLLQTMIHEIGHLLGLVPDGVIEGGTFYPTSDLDRSPMLYNGHGHYGNHCAYGMRTAAEQTLPDPLPGPGFCAMFGSSPSEQHFCRRCVSAVRKQRLNQGWNRFAWDFPSWL